MATPGPVTPQVIRTHNPPAPPPAPGAKPSSVPNAQAVEIASPTKVDKSTQFPIVEAPRRQLSERIKQGIEHYEAPKQVQIPESTVETPRPGDCRNDSCRKAG